MKKIAIFVDVQNIYYTTRDAHQRQFNYRRLWQTLNERASIVQAYAYAIDRGDTSQQKFQSALTHIGFNVKLKPFISRADGSAKGDWDVGITIDMLKSASAVDEVILLSGDGDFAILLDELRVTHGVSSTVYGVPKLTANALIKAADTFHPIDIEDLL